jgi:hypothetical protein
VDAIWRMPQPLKSDIPLQRLPSQTVPLQRAADEMDAPATAADEPAAEFSGEDLFTALARLGVVSEATPSRETGAQRPASTGQQTIQRAVAGDMRPSPPVQPSVAASDNRAIMRDDTTPETMQPSTGSKIDIEKLARDVFRELKDRLRIERERRSRR